MYAGASIIHESKEIFKLFCDNNLPTPEKASPDRFSTQDRSHVHAVDTVFELVKIKAAHYGVLVTNSEVVGYVPIQAMIHTTAYYLQMDSFDMDQALEYNFDFEI